MRLDPRAGERIDRSNAVSFTFAGWKITGFEGDTIASAAFAAGKRVFSRSFKYHRPRGLLCCSGHCPNCQMTVDGVPNVRVCTEPIREGAVVEGQNVRWSLDFDFMSLTDKVGGPFTPVGFYYRTFIRPRAAWPLYEKFLRSAAGLGKLDPHAGHTPALRHGAPQRARARRRRRRGRTRGRARGGEGRSRRRPRRRGRGAPRSRLAGVEVLAPATRARDLGGRSRSGRCRHVLYRFRAERIVVATGATEQPLVFPGNDLVGVMLPDGVRRLIRDFSIKPGERAVVLGSDDETLAIADELSEVGIEVAKVVDLRDARPRELAAQGGKGRVRRLVLDGESSLRPSRRLRRPPAGVLAPRTGGRARRVRRRARRLRADRASCRASRRSAASRARVSRRSPPNPRTRQGQVLRLHLRGRDDEGHEARDRRGLRLDRAREALHDVDDGPLPGQALPPREHPRVRAGEPACTSPRSARRPRGRRGRPSSSACSPAAS